MKRALLVLLVLCVAPLPSAAQRRHAVSPPEAPPHPIDAETFAKMKRDGIVPAPRSSDAEFLRRIALDLTGAIPDADQVKAFLADPDPKKRERVTDELIASDGFVDRWTMWLGDVVQNVSFSMAGRLQHEGRNTYHAYLRASIASNKPYDQLVRELISATGPAYTNGPVNFWIRQIQIGPVQDTYDNLAAASVEKFLGMPMNCLSCHDGRGHLEAVNSGLSKRTRMEFWKTAAFFAQGVAQPAGIEYGVRNDPRGEYRLNTDFGNKTPRFPAPGIIDDTVAPEFFLTGERPREGEERRVAYARMLTAHPQFARAAVNLIWKELFGRGLVEPVHGFDLAKLDTQPSHPRLLEQLAASFVTSGHDIRALIRLIVTSETYQLSAAESAAAPPEYFASRVPRRLMAEAVLDAIFKATGVGGQLTVRKSNAVPRAMMLPDTVEGAPYDTFLDEFRRGNRDDDPRSGDPSIPQALRMLNDPIVTTRVKNARRFLATEDPIAAVYLATLSRHPTGAERAAATAELAKGDPGEAIEDLQFALLQSPDFLFH